MMTFVAEHAKGTIQGSIAGEKGISSPATWPVCQTQVIIVIFIALQWALESSNFNHKYLRQVGYLVIALAYLCMYKVYMTSMHSE